MDNFVGAVDQGTTGTRFMVFDRDASVVSNVYEKHEQIYPKPGWVEHDASEIWKNTKKVVRNGLEKAGVEFSDLEAIGVTNQRETTVVWDSEGEPVHNALVWQDKRTTERVEEIVESGWKDVIREKTGLEVDSYFSATKLEWLLENAVEAERDTYFGTVDSWLIYKMTGEHVTDSTNASRTMLYNIHEMDWDDELLEEFGIPKDVLPEVRPSSVESYGYASGEIFGFDDYRVPVSGALGDQQAALFGQTCFEKGEAKNTYGTGSFFLTNTGKEAVESDHGLLTTVGFHLSGEEPRYALEGSVFVTGAAIEWLEEIDIIDDASEIERLARQADSSDGVYFVPAFTGLGAPHWDQRARGTLIGLTRGTEKEHIARATLESIAYQTRDVAEAMERDISTSIDVLKVDGGAVKNNLLCELQADITHTKIDRPVIDETTALGAAYAAGLGVDYWEGVEELREKRKTNKEFNPGYRDYEEAYERWLNAVERSKGWNEES